MSPGGGENRDERVTRAQRAGIKSYSEKEKKKKKRTCGWSCGIGGFPVARVSAIHTLQSTELLQVCTGLLMLVQVGRQTNPPLSETSKQQEGERAVRWV